MSTVISESEVVTNIAYNVRELMADRGWSQAELARRSQLSPMQINHIVHGRQQIGAFFVARLIEAFKCSFDQLIKEPPPSASRRAG
jgi:transcriptional regulator with XRE-family HTH domain